MSAMAQRSLVVGSEDELAVAVLALRDAWERLKASGKPLGLVLYPWAPRRKLAQQGLMWLRLGEIAEQAWVDGVRFGDAAWHAYFKRAFLPEEEGPSGRVAKGYRKWRFLPDGTRELVGSTTELTLPGMAEYVQQIEAYGARELGVRFSAHPALELELRR